MLQQILQYLIYFEDNNKLDNLFAFLNEKTQLIFQNHFCIFFLTHTQKKKPTIKKVFQFRMNSHHKDFTIIDREQLLFLVRFEAKIQFEDIEVGDEVGTWFGRGKFWKSDGNPGGRGGPPINEGGREPQGRTISGEEAILNRSNSDSCSRFDLARLFWNHIFT